jgi:pSer/pThr/pTyr-binding forkhead associated (FHA) protein
MEGPRRMTVGRGSDNDIVLRDRSVSKVHGWIEADGFAHLCAGDANSTNHTHVNGTRLTTPVEVHPGCCIRFGSVETYLYRTQSLWQLLHSGGV